MPYTIRKLPNTDQYRVRNKETGEIKARATSRQNAERLVRLLNAVHHGWTPSRNK